MIRLATAHAKARMSRTVTAQDAHAAIELVQYAYFKKVLEKENKKRRRGDAETDDSEDDNDDNNQRSKRRPAREHSDDEIESTQRSTRSSQVAVTEDAVTTVNGSESVQEEEMSVDETATISDERLALFKNGLQRTFRDSRSQSLALPRVRDSINSNNPDPFSQGEINAALHRMTEDNQIMLADGIVFLI